MKGTQRIIDVGYGRATLRDMYTKGDMSSRLFYGLIELEGKYDVRHVSLDSRSSLVAAVRSSLLVLQPADCVYMTYLYEQPLVLLSFLRQLGFFRRRKVVVVSHKQLKTGRTCWQRWLYRMVYRNVNMILFHSQKNLEESVAAGMVDAERTRFFYWGDDLSYVDRTYSTRLGSFFISTGRENRDFDLLVRSFAQTDAQLELYTNRINYGNNYEKLERWQGRWKNVLIEFVDKSNDTTLRLGQRTAEALCVVIPLMKNHVNYCVGLTSIIEAMAMGKPIISSPNPYSPVDIEAEGIGIVAETEEQWVEAIRYMMSHREDVEQMGRRARRLAEERYNILSTARLLDEVLTSLQP